MVSGISLANKSQLLFGFSLVVILGVALSVPWFRTRSLVVDHQRELMREQAHTWLRGQIELGRFNRQDTATPDEEVNEGSEFGSPPPPFSPLFDRPLRINFVWIDKIETATDDPDNFLSRAKKFFAERSDAREWMQSTRLEGDHLYQYALPLRQREVRGLRRGLAPYELEADDAEAGEPGEVRALVIIDHRSNLAADKLLVTRIYIVAAWLFASLLAILVFYFILTKLIFSPVRRLRETAEKVQSGDTSARASIETGDEFEQLSEAFNSMLERISEGQLQLRRMNETLDLRLSELAEANFALYESNRLKGEFLASVSHELKTPLNSIVGFSELLDEMAESDIDADPKRRRYLDNILTSARALLEMINDLLEMAKIEAGRVELSVETTNIADLIDGLATLMRPQAEKRQVTIETKIGANTPTIDTDAGKLQQIIYNFVSNAVKFSPVDGTVTVTAERLVRQDRAQSVRIGVIDQGPGIPSDMQDTIFDKFRQIDASHTREHQGVGLGLAICRELSALIGASLSVVSEPGAGAAFYVEVPLTYQPPQPKPLMEGAASES